MTIIGRKAIDQAMWGAVALLSMAYMTAPVWIAVLVMMGAFYLLR